MAKANPKVKKVMDEFVAGKLHSGSKKGPIVADPQRALAIAFSEARQAGQKGEGKPRKK